MAAHLPVEEASVLGFQLQLRRIGAAASCPGVKDVFRLNKSRTILGRNASAVDCFVDSVINTRLISRQHAEIIIELDENQCPAISVVDRSLNGTFVNDTKIRAHDKLKLKVGDTVTLGHLKGIQIEPGFHDEQPNSEFRFVLENSHDASIASKTELSAAMSASPQIANKSRLLRSPNRKGNATAPIPRSIGEIPPPPPMMHQPIALVTESKNGDHVTPVSKNSVAEHMTMTKGEDGKMTFTYSVQVSPTSPPKPKLKNAPNWDEKAEKSKLNQQTDHKHGNSMKVMDTSTQNSMGCFIKADLL